MMKREPGKMPAEHDKKKIQLPFQQTLQKIVRRVLHRADAAQRSQGIAFRIRHGHEGHKACAFGGGSNAFHIENGIVIGGVMQRAAAHLQ